VVLEGKGIILGGELPEKKVSLMGGQVSLQLLERKVWLSGVGLVTLGVTSRKKDTHEYEVLFPAEKGRTLQERKVWFLELKMWLLKGKVYSWVRSCGSLK
jgi:hypothetical protein